MIDEKKIEEAAKDYAWDNRSDEWGEEEMLDTMRAFKTGINWFKKNLWHDASEEPKKGKRLFVEAKIADGKLSYYREDQGDSLDWCGLVRLCRYTRWLYIEDLMKGGGK